MKSLLIIALISAALQAAPVGSQSAGQAQAGSQSNSQSAGQAQQKNADGVIEVAPERNPEGRMLTMQEAHSRSVYPIKAKQSMIKGALLLKDEPELDLSWLPQSGGGIVYGQSVSRNEFGIDGGIFPSPDGSRIAFYRKDETAVKQFPLLDIDSRTGSLKPLRYPMNGMASEKITLGVYNEKNGKIVYCKVTDFTEERYLTGISWTPDSKTILIHVVDREQHHMHLNAYNAANGNFIKTILTEENSRWIEPQDPVWFISDKEFIYRTDNRDGYKNLYLCTMDGKVKRLTKVDADVDFIGIRNGWIYYYSAEVSPIEQHVFRIKPGGNPQRITKESGWHKIILGEDAIVDEFSSCSNPGWTRLFNLEGKRIISFAECPNPLEEFAQGQVEIGSTKAADGVTDNYYRLIKPVNFDPAKKYPLIVYVYGGPHSQLVTNSWLGNIRMWEMLMAQKGYVVYVQDNRGTSNRGAEFEKAINRQCGQVEMADQIVGLEALLERADWIDRNRIGVHGWSYGGFMTLSLATNFPQYFKVAVAGGPVIDWKWYEVMYGERYMDTPETNPEGFAITSLLDMAPQLRSKTLICQGAMDDTVVWEHSLSFLQACIDAGRQVDYFPFPKALHNMYGGERVYLYQKITDFFEANL